MFNVPESFLKDRKALGFDRIDYGVGGVLLLRPADLPDAQVGYSVTPEGVTLVTGNTEDWHSDWVVIGNETACGDPIFLSTKPPHALYTAMEGQDSWKPKLVAPSLASFWACLAVFSEFARGRSNPVELEANPPKEKEISAYLESIHWLCNGNAEAIDFWVVQAEIGMDSSE